MKLYIKNNKLNALFNNLNVVKAKKLYALLNPTKAKLTKGNCLRFGDYIYNSSHKLVFVNNRITEVYDIVCLENKIQNLTK